jgi:hypothetical protein
MFLGFVRTRRRNAVHRLEIDEKVARLSLWNTQGYFPQSGNGKFEELTEAASPGVEALHSRGAVLCLARPLKRGSG